MPHRVAYLWLYLVVAGASGVYADARQIHFDTAFDLCTGEEPFIAARAEKLEAAGWSELRNEVMVRDAAAGPAMGSAAFVYRQRSVGRTLEQAAVIVESLLRGFRNADQSRIYRSPPALGLDPDTFVLVALREEDPSSDEDILRLESIAPRCQITATFSPRSPEVLSLGEPELFHWGGVAYSLTLVGPLRKIIAADGLEQEVASVSQFRYRTSSQDLDLGSITVGPFVHVTTSSAFIDSKDKAIYADVMIDDPRFSE